ncbi:LacI family DNA-binding transcriptional regulator [Leifsonia sp. ZF2019]|uniref:LacI family DNA-binding transcriptional regulator n=1 Tax=Leifsonia sp. ZF2019 TaxID=2781978 RepID=UPI001CBDFF75|nr:LacI family DNA-binding transcriptional regulator [Leifsonia sp. ZF2019]UAJ79225.1 LacI family DNA-binding transcriptional regulator [Leifsonia sp. ZF2019]
MAVSRKGGPVTLKDVAAHARVSLSTASRALNGSSRNVSDALRARVERSAADLNYSTNLLAQGIARGLSETVAVMVGSIVDPYFAGIVSGVTEVAEANGLVVTIITTGGDPSRERSALNAIRGQRPRHVVMTVSRTLDEDTEERVGRALADYEQMGGTVAFVGGGIEGFRTLEVDNAGAARALGGALVAAGYQRFALLGGPSHLATPVARQRGFVEGVTAAGGEAPLAWRIPSKINRAGGYAAAAQILATGARPDCFFAVADVMAIGALAAIRDAGLVPGVDVGIAGFGDVELLEDFTPSLTTVRLPLERMGRQAVELVLDPHPGALVSSIGGEVMLRASTPPRPTS